MIWLQGVNWGAVSGWAVGLVAPILVYLATRRKSDIDESQVILGKWKELVEAHEASIKRLNEDFDRERRRSASENDRLMARVSELETKVSDQATEIEALKAENAGLKRAIAQNSQSAAYELGTRTRRNSDAFPEKNG